jgi:hypothetical protein
MDTKIAGSKNSYRCGKNASFESLHNGKDFPDGMVIK